MIPGFRQSRVATNGIELSVHRAGDGPQLILLHGYPQNHHCWEKVAPAFSKYFDVIVPDLRGYGQSDAPTDDAGHTVYSKRTMAQDIVGLMDALGLQDRISSAMTVADASAIGWPWITPTGSGGSESSRLYQRGISGRIGTPIWP